MESIELINIFSTDCLEFNPSSSASTEIIIIQGVATCNIEQITALRDIPKFSLLSSIKQIMIIIGQNINLLKHKI